MKREIYFDSDLFQRRIFQIDQAVQLINHAIDAYNELGAHKMNEAAFIAAIRSDFTEVEHLLTKAIVKQLDNTGTTLASLRKASIEKTLDDFYENVRPLFIGLRQYTVDVPDTGFYNLVKYLEFKNGRVNFTPAGREKLKTELTVSLHGEAAEQLYNLQNEVGGKLEQLAALIGIKTWHLPAHLFGNVFRIEMDSNKLTPCVLDYNNAQPQVTQTV